MKEIGIRNPAVMDKGEPADSRGERNMEITFKVSAKSMYSEINSRDELFLQRQLFNNACGNSRDFIHEVAVDPEEIPKDAGQGEGEMLPFGVGKRVEAVFDPNVCGFFTAGRTEPGLAGVKDFLTAVAFGADSKVKAKERCSASHGFQDVDDNAGPDKIVVFEEEFTPVAIMKKNGFQLDTGNVLHMNSVAKEYSKGKLPPKAA